MQLYYKIGDFRFRICSNENLPVPLHFKRFETEPGEIDYTYHMESVKELSMPFGTVTANRQDLMVYQTREGEIRLVGIKGASEFYACYRELSEQEAEIQILEKERSMLEIDTVFTSLFALERHMVKRNSLILHCAYIRYQDKGILFSAPSETGKSTQAGLWEQYRNSRTINGDRALLRKMDGKWTACGWPVCGSSEICNNEDTPIHAIVVLGQSPDNHVKKLSPLQAFTDLYGQITTNRWNKEAVQQALTLVENLAGEIPVYRLDCNISEDAVCCLEQILFSVAP